LTIQSQKYPNLYLIGTPRAGTTTLFSKFQRSHDIYTPHEKEPSYFRFKGEKSVNHNGKIVPTFEFQHNEKAYLDLYQDWSCEPYAIDASTNYLSHPNVAQEIHNHNPDAKVIAILRPPVERAFSHYLMEVRDGWVTGNFLDALLLEIDEIARDEGHLPSTAGHYSFIRQSLYLAGVTDFFSTFGKDQFRVYRFEDIINGDGAALDDIYRFLDISSIATQAEEKVQNAYAVDRFPMLTKLINIYRHSRLRPIVNFLTPRAARDVFRTKMYDIRRKKSRKPSMPEDAATLLQNHLKGDFADTLEFCRSNRIIFDKTRA